MPIFEVVPITIDQSKVLSILPSSSEESLSCYYILFLLLFLFTKSLVGDSTHCLSVGLYVFKILSSLK